MSRLLARALFGALVIATVAAFFVAQRVKQSTPVVEKVRFTKYFSPNGDGVRDTSGLSFRLKETDRVDVEIANEQGDRVRRVAADRGLCGPCTHEFRWDGRDDDGEVARDGEYFLRVVLREQGRSVTSPRKIFLDTEAPRPVIRAVSPDAISPDGNGLAESARLVFEGPAGEVGGSTVPKFVVYRTGADGAEAVARFDGRRGERIARWNGLIDGLPAPPGNYLISVRVSDAAGNLGAAPALRPRRGDSRGRPGVRVRYIEAVAPERAVLGGSRARFSVRTERDRYRWSIRRAGAGRPERRGGSSVRGGVPLTPRVPGAAGLYLLEMRAGNHLYKTPFAVRSQRPQPLLVVVPTLAWQGSNLYDADQDGWGETLATEDSVARRRPIAGDGLPTGVTSGLTALFRSLDSQRARYDVTTDLALIGGRGPDPADHKGVLFAGDERLFPRQAARRLARYVRGGGRIGWIGIDSFHRRVVVDGDRIVRGERRRLRADPFGERTVIERQRPAPLEPGRDRIGFFSQVLPSFGSFSEFERSIELPARARLLAGAGPPTGGLAAAVYRLGEGVVARIDPGGFDRGLASDAGSRAVLERLVALLGGSR